MNIVFIFNKCYLLKCHLLYNNITTVFQQFTLLSPWKVNHCMLQGNIIETWGTAVQPRESYLVQGRSVLYNPLQRHRCELAQLFQALKTYASPPGRAIQLDGKDRAYVLKNYLHIGDWLI